MRDGAADRERRAAAGVAVELGQDQPVEPQARGEALRHVHRLSALQRVADQDLQLRLDARRHLLELGHQRLVDLQAAGGVEDHGVVPVLASVGHRVLADRGGVVCVADEHVDADLLAEPERELCRRRRLARAL